MYGRLWLIEMIDICLGIFDSMLIVRCMISVCVCVCELDTSIECAFTRVKT